MRSCLHVEWHKETRMQLDFRGKRRFFASMRRSVLHLMWHVLVGARAQDLTPMKFLRHKGASKGFLLLSCTFSLFLIAEGRTRFTNVKVGVFLDCWKRGETSLENYGVNIAEYNRTTTLTNISLQIETIQLNGLSFEEISRAFCSDIVEDNVTVIVLQTRNRNLLQFVGNLASYYKIPAIGSLSQEPLLSDKVGQERIVTF